MAKIKKRKPDLKRIRPSKTYTLLEIAKALDRNIATVRSWVRKGLPLLSDQKPVLVLGSNLKEWLQARRKEKQQKCQLDELFCFKCWVPRKPKTETVEIILRSKKKVSVKGLCIVCDTRMYQAKPIAMLSQLEKYFRTLAQDKQRLVQSNEYSRCQSTV